MLISQELADVYGLKFNVISNHSQYIHPYSGKGIRDFSRSQAGAWEPGNSKNPGPEYQVFQG